MKPYGSLRASRDIREVSACSRLVADLAAQFYSSAIPQFARGDLLDLGCGKAPLYGLYKEYVRSSTCVDWPNSLHGNSHVDVIQDLNGALAFRDSSFDTIILSDVLEHVRKPALLLRETARILRPGGVLLLNVPYYYWIHEIPYDYYRYTKFGLTHLVSSAGLVTERLESLGGALEVLGDLIAKCIALAFPRFGYLPAGMVQSFAERLCSYRLGAKVSARSKDLFPLAYAMIATRPNLDPS